MRGSCGGLVGRNPQRRRNRATRRAVNCKGFLKRGASLPVTKTGKPRFINPGLARDIAGLVAGCADVCVEMCHAEIFAPDANPVQAVFCMTCISAADANGAPCGMFRIRQIRKAKQLGLEALSAASGVDYTLLSKIERGKSWPGRDKLEAIAAALNVPIHELFDTFEPLPPSVAMLAEALKHLPDDRVQKLADFLRSETEPPTR